MATAKLMETKDGMKFYKISVSRGYGVSPYTTRWYVPDGWSRRAIESGLKNAIHEFQSKIDAGEVQSRAEAKEAERKQAEEDAKILTLRQYSEKVFMPQVALTASEHTRDNFQRILDVHVLPTLGGLRMKDITPRQIQALMLSLQKPNDKGKTLSHATLVKIYTVLSLIFKSAFLDDTIPISPMLKVQRPKVQKAAEAATDEVEAFTADELRYILKCLDGEPLKWQAIIRLLIDSGARKGEVLGLRWSDVDFKSGSITIRRTLAYTPAKGIYANSPKSGRQRTVFISPDVVELLKQLKAEHKIVTLTNSADQYIFTQDDGILPIHPDSPNRYCKKFGDKYGIKNFHPHKLRHSFASIAIVGGADVVSVSEKLGHADVATTLRVYAHSNSEAQKRASDVFRNALDTAKKA